MEKRFHLRGRSPGSSISADGGRFSATQGAEEHLQRTEATLLNWGRITSKEAQFMNRRSFLMTPLGAVVVAAAASGQSGYKAESAGPCALPDVSDAMKATLQPEGVRIADAKGVLCEIWLRKIIPQKAGSADAQYSTVDNGTFAGIIHYPARAGDYRGQALKPGIYTMRFQAMPADGNHMGCAPSADFVLLALAGTDKDPNAVVGYEELVRISLKGSGTSHPIPLYLTIPEGAATATFRSADEHHWAVEVKTKAQPSGGAEIDFPVAIVLIGKSEG
jgi:hypothetical protein